MARIPLLFLVVFLLSAATAAAQPTFRFGMRGGFNRATSTVEASHTSPSSAYYYLATKSPIHTWQGGAVLEVAFRRFSLQPALLFSQKGERLGATTSISGFAGVSSTEVSSVKRFNWLELPVNVVYGLHNFQVFAGPYVALGVGGRERGTQRQASPTAKYARIEFTKKVQYGSNTENRRLDAGVNFGLGYRKGPWQVQLGYGVGLLNLHQVDPDYTVDSVHNFGEDAAYNRVAQLTGTYFFEL
ncbi:MAG TPA: porin family protein [Hymenobacter sp.]|jgi:hypothetical protein|uniref:porin family protein n=1 Tax=Hymenobacter sp. TaxID=1898978 RepID=UPI002ED7A009